MARLAHIIAALVVLTAAPARADYRETVQVLRIGVVWGQLSGSSPQKIEAAERAFSTALDIPVEIVRFPTYAALIDAHASARVQYAVHSAVSYAATEAACGCVAPLRRPVGADGRIGFRSVLVVRADAAEDLGALRVAFSDEASLSSYAIPRQAMASGALASPVLVKAGSVGAAIELYLDRSVDGFFAWIPEVDGRAASVTAADLFGGLHAERLAEAGTWRSVWLSEPVLNGPHALHRQVPDDLVEALGTFLDTMPERTPGLFDILEPVFSGGYAAAAAGDYRSLRPLVEMSARR